MALDVYLQSRIEAPRVGGDCEFVCAFDDNGTFWFFQALFEQLKRKTGQQIDLYGDAFFYGETLNAFSEFLALAHLQLENQPPIWEVVTGWSIYPTRAEIRSKVNKQRILDLLSALNEAVETAKSSSAYLTFWGD